MTRVPTPAAPGPRQWPARRPRHRPVTRGCRRRGPAAPQWLGPSQSVKGLADQPTVRVDANRVHDPTGLGIGSQHITQLGGRGLVRHTHAKPGAIAEGRRPPRSRKMDCRHVQGHEDGIDTPLIEQGVEDRRDAGQRARLRRSGALPRCRGGGGGEWGGRGGEGGGGRKGGGEGGGGGEGEGGGGGGGEEGLPGCGKLCCGKYAQFSEQLCPRDRDQVLRIKHTRAQKARRNRHFKA